MTPFAPGALTLGVSFEGRPIERVLLQLEEELEIRVASDFIFINSTRLRLGLDNYASFSHILGVLRQSGVGVVRVGGEVNRRDWQVFVSLLLSFSTRATDPNKVQELQQKLLQGGVTHMVVEPPADGEPVQRPILEHAQDEEVEGAVERVVGDPGHVAALGLRVTSKLLR